MTWPQFAATAEPKRTIAARAAVLFAHLRNGAQFDFAAHRYTGKAEQIEVVRAATLNGTPYEWIDRIKAVNPEAYFYSHRAIQLGQPKLGL